MEIAIGAQLLATEKHRKDEREERRRGKRGRNSRSRTVDFVGQASTSAYRRTQGRREPFDSLASHPPLAVRTGVA
jgi:hypothetical protein